MDDESYFNARVKALAEALVKEQNSRLEARQEAERYKKLYESATKRKHEIYLCLVAAKKALEEAI
jgi:hypothetical protein